MRVEVAVAPRTSHACSCIGWRRSDLLLVKTSKAVSRVKQQIQKR
jgi:hypothetical protein